MRSQGGCGCVHTRASNYADEHGDGARRSVPSLRSKLSTHAGNHGDPQCAIASCDRADDSANSIPGSPQSPWDPGGACRRARNAGGIPDCVPAHYRGHDKGRERTISRKSGHGGLRIEGSMGQYRNTTVEPDDRGNRCGRWFPPSGGAWNSLDVVLFAGGSGCDSRDEGSPPAFANGRLDENNGPESGSRGDPATQLETG